MTRHIHFHIHRYPTRDAFVPTQHPRGQPENKGEFVAKGSGTTTTAKAPTRSHLPGKAAPAKRSAKPHLPGGGAGINTRNKKIHETMMSWPKDDKDLPDHIRNLKWPPAWTNKRYNPDPKGRKMVDGYDEAGRRQPLYRTTYQQETKSEAFKICKKIEAKMPQYIKINDRNMKSRDAKERQHAECMKLIMETGVRPGSDRDTKAAKQAYGATNMLGQHVVVEGRNTYLRFTGKKGVEQNILIEDQAMADLLRDHAKKAGPTGKIFPVVDSNSLRRYSQKNFKITDTERANPKDFRTVLGTRLAFHTMHNLPVPKNTREMKKLVAQVAKETSEKLGNTPAICLKSYINPYVWDEWTRSLKQPAR